MPSRSPRTGMPLNGWACVSKGYQTPVGGLSFLAGCFILVMALYSMKVVSLTTLIQLPNATFLLTYLSGSAAGVCLFKRDRRKLAVSLVSLASTAIMFLFVGWAIVYPVVVILFVLFGITLPKSAAVRMRKG
ncbi:hypothetical protein QS257_10015 [Terrilactibacillus sp. S3-3]|nr:hypothetical protein QS257_10015 [Terrilactibacillus sp. S3-3]